MLERLNPETVAKPVSNYSQAIAVPGMARLLYVSGQLGVRADGWLAEGVEAQALQAWRNVEALVVAGGMALEDLVKVTVYLTKLEDLPFSRKARETILGDVSPASTLLIVSSLANPRCLIEVDAIAAR